MKTAEYFVKVKIESEEDLPKKAAWVIVKNKMLIPEAIYFTWDDRKWWLDHIDWYLLPVEQIELPSNEEIDEWADFCASNSVTNKDSLHLIKAASSLGAKWAVKWIKDRIK